MAKDFYLKHLCPHYVVGEWVAIEIDRRTLNPVRFPSNQEVRIVKNGMDIPKEGVQSRIGFAGKTIEPFEIVENRNDTFRFVLNEGYVQTVHLPVGRRITTRQVVDAINQQANGIKAKDSNGHVRIESLEAGPEVSLFLAKGSGHETLGLPKSRFYQGREVVPPWRIVRTNPVDTLARTIVFDRPLPAADDIFEISYYTRPQDCRRCQGLGIENDLRHDVYGNPEFVTGVDLLAQEAEKIVLTQRGSNVFYTWYGTSLINLVGQKIPSGGRILETQLVSEIGMTLDRYKDVKMQQSRYQPVGDQEFLMRVKNIFVSQDENDPTVFRVRIDLQNRAGQIEELKKTLVLNNINGSELVG
jgi:hypothetical protein